jgi:hypothetical protein
MIPMPALATLSRFEWLIRVRPNEVTQTMSQNWRASPNARPAGDERGIAKAHVAAYWVHLLAAAAQWLAWRRRRARLAQGQQVSSASKEVAPIQLCASVPVFIK